MIKQNDTRIDVLNDEQLTQVVGGRGCGQPKPKKQTQFCHEKHPKNDCKVPDDGCHKDDKCQKPSWGGCGFGGFDR